MISGVFLAKELRICGDLGLRLQGFRIWVSKV